ncbi:hypothetical protein [Streptomyces sp. 3N207]|uniref:hypothetical protein n=1 Tax=Streptomyces sp. 3N207 TaxID=3457417 RepID=UPI003FD61C13
MTTPPRAHSPAVAEVNEAIRHLMQQPARFPSTSYGLQVPHGTVDRALELLARTARDDLAVAEIDGYGR